MKFDIYFATKIKLRIIVVTLLHGPVLLEGVEGLQLLDDVLPAADEDLDLLGVGDVLVLHEGVVDLALELLGVLGVFTAQEDELEKQKVNFTDQCKFCSCFRNTLL